MIKKILVLLIVILNFDTSQGQEFDTTLYNSLFEANLFEAIIDSAEIDPLDLLIAIDYSDDSIIDLRTKLEGLKKEMNEKNIRSKSAKKQIKEIYKNVHSDLLEKYVENIYFSQIFNNGEYNCVSASALYALLLDDYSINYQIKETPTHVYLVADPLGDPTLIESTLPKNGILYFDEAFKKDFIQYLQKNKLISQKEYESKSLNELFDEYYNNDKNINIYELAALQYYNKGVFYIQDEDYYNAQKNFKKAYTIYPSTTIQYMYSATLGELLNQQVLEKVYHGETLAEFLNLNAQSSESLSLGLEYFEIIANELVINHPQIETFEKYYADFVSQMSDTLNISDFKVLYYLKLSYYDYANGFFSDALKKLEKAYVSNPENLQIRLLVSEISAKYMITDRNHKSMIDVMEYYFAVFPFLLENANYQEYYTYSYLRVIRTEYNRNDLKEGKLFLDRFKELLSESPDLFLNEYAVEDCFVAVSLSYLKNGDINNAINYINEGLEYYPESDKLKDVSKSLKELKQDFKQTYSPEPKKAVLSAEAFKNKFLETFPNCWIENGGESNKIQAKESRKVEYTIGEREEVGRWAYRSKSKLLYLIPERNEDDYLMFKVVSVEKGNIMLRLYVDNKLSKDVIYLSECKD